MKEYSKDLPKWGLLYILIWFQFGYPCTSYSIWEKCSYRIRNIFKFEICLSCELFVKSSRSMDFSLKLECNFLSKHSYWVTALQANFCISRTEKNLLKILLWFRNSFSNANSNKRDGWVVFLERTAFSHSFLQLFLVCKMRGHTYQSLLPNQTNPF